MIIQGLRSDITAIEGDSFIGRRFRIKRNGVFLSLTNATALMVVSTMAGDPVSTLTTQSGGLEIQDEFFLAIPVQKFPWPAGSYKYYIRITIGTWAKTYPRGKIRIKRPDEDV